MSYIQQLSILVVPVLLAIIVHEVAHGWAALKLGDTTAKSLGRLTLNPISHIDPVGTLILPAVMFFTSGFIFGWAKPVPVDMSKLRNPRRDMMIVALAGPASNLLMMLMWAILLKIAIASGATNESMLGALAITSSVGILVNAILMMLNLLPIPPLDGSRVVEGLLPLSMAQKYSSVGRYGFVILIVLVFSGGLSMVMGPLIDAGIWIATTFTGLPAQLPRQILGM